MAKNVRLITGRDEVGAPANVGVGMDEHGLLVLISPGAQLAGRSQELLRGALWQAVKDEMGPTTAELLLPKLSAAVEDHFMKLGGREIHLDPDNALAYQKLVRAVNSTV